MRRLLPPAVVFAAAALTLAQDTPPPAAKKEPVKYRSGDMKRPRPPVVEPPGWGSEEAPGKPPSDAVVLFDGTNLDAWFKSGKKPGNPDAVPHWKVENGYAEIVRGGGITTREKFGDAQWHIEWATPKEVKGNGQGRGNSGVHLGGFGEIQVLDSFQNDTYPDGQAAALYGKLPPLVNASRKPGEWQAYDIVAHLPKSDEAGKVVKPGIITVLHNGVVVHHAVEFPGKFGEFNIHIQDHGNPVRYRNIWVRKLGEYDDGTPPPEPKKK
jgi:hypothetical protein